MRSLGLAAAIVGFAAALAGLLWLTAYFLAPPLFGALWHGAPSPSTPYLLAALPPLVVGIPFGLAFGVLPWRRATILALVIAVLAATVDFAMVMRAGIDPTGPQARPYAAGDALFVVVFVGAAWIGGRMARGSGAARRGWLGTWAWLVLGAAVCVAAAWSWTHVMPRGV